MLFVSPVIACLLAVYATDPGRGAVADIGLERLDDAHGRWALAERRQLGSDSFAAYSRLR